MAKSKKKKFLRLLSKNKKAIFVCFLIFILLFLFSYSNKPPRKSEIMVHTGNIQSFESHHSSGKGTSRWDYVILLNNQQFHLGPFGRSEKEDLELLQKLQNEKTKITIEVAERSVLSKITSPAFSNMPTVLGMRSEDQTYHPLNQSLKEHLERQLFILFFFCPLPLIALVFILKERWEYA